nr:unnamed protein product [Callosobruchus analis]
MGGVDKTDFLIQLYRIFIRSRKWTLRVIFHFVTMSITNSWLEYRQDAKLRNIPKKENLHLLSFTFSIDESLAKCDRMSFQERKDVPGADYTPQLYKKKLKIDVRPQTDVRYNAVGHWPVMDLKPQRCKKELCQSRSRYLEPSENKDWKDNKQVENEIASWPILDENLSEENISAAEENLVHHPVLIAR